MRKLEVLLQRLWLKKPGTYHCSVSFYNGDEALEASLEGHCPFIAKRNGLLWEIGPVLGSDSNGKSHSFNGIKFVCHLPEEIMQRPTLINLAIFEEVPISFPSTSQNAESTTDLKLQGKSALQLRFSGKVLNSKHSGINYHKEYTQRLMVNSTARSGGVKFNLGSLILKSIIHQELGQEISPRAKSVEMSLGVKSISPVMEQTEQFSSQVVFAPARQESFHEVARSSTLPNLMFEARESLPALNAVKQILPMYYHLVKSPPNRRESVKPYSHINDPAENQLDGSVSPKADGIPELKAGGLGDDTGKLPHMVNANEETGKELDKHVISVLEYQTKELDRYRQAIRQMGELIVELRSQISSLETKNSQLRANVYYTGRSSQAVADNENNSYAGSMKMDLMDKIEEVEEQKLLILKQQNELIKKNEFEKKYLKLLKAHQSQQAMLHDYQGKISKYNLLEKTCRQQEKIIRELESNGSRSRSKKISLSDSTAEKAKSVSFQEDATFSKKSGPQNDNRIAQSTSLQLVPSTGQGKQYYDQFYDVEERMALLQKLEKADGRIMALERQIMDNTRQWAREKSQSKFRTSNGVPDFLGFERRYPAPLTYAMDQTGFEDVSYGNPQFRARDSYTRFPHF